MSTPIKEQIEAKLKEARVARDERAKNVIGMLKSKVLNELKSGSGAQENDELWLAQIQSYAKQMRKALPEYESAGERGADLLAEARYEIEFCEQFLPKKLGEAETEAIVRQVAAANGITGPKLIGKLTGLVMKDHKESIDGDTLRRVAQRVLAE
jgi:uncharacterized protein YqeY